MTRLTPILLGLTFVIAVAALALVLWLVVTEPWEPDEFAANANPTVVIEATPEPYQRGQRLSSFQVKRILESYINNDTLRDGKGSGCLWWEPSGVSLRDTVTWRYWENLRMWEVLAVGHFCDGIQRWFVDEITGQVVFNQPEK